MSVPWVPVLLPPKPAAALPAREELETHHGSVRSTVLPLQGSKQAAYNSWMITSSIMTFLLKADK